MNAFRSRDFATAQRIFGQLTRTNPANAHAWKLLGMAYAAEDKTALAEPAFDRSCRLNPKEENACYYLGRAQYSIARFSEALRSFSLALPQGGAARGRVLLGMGLCEEALGQLRQAEEHYRAAITAGERQAIEDYGLFLFKQGRDKESLSVLQTGGSPESVERVRKAIASGEHTRGTSGLPVGKAIFEAKPLPMTVRNGGTGDKHLIETMTAGVAVLDYDGDGWPDIYVANGSTVPDLQKADPSYFNRLFRNNRDGTFTDVTERSGTAGRGYSMGVAAADFDNDGHVDLFVTGVRSNTLYRNRGDGTFEDATERAHLNEQGKWSVAAGWFDYNNDGLLDLFVVRYVVWDPATEIFCGAAPDAATNRGGYRQYCAPKYYEPLGNALYRNRGDGTFEDVSAQSGIGALRGKGMGIAFGDYDGDGRLDVFVANDTMPNFLFRNNGDGTFQEVALEAGVAYNDDGKPISSMGVAFEDIDNDGREDLFITALSNETFPLFRNMGGGRFADRTYPSGIGKGSFPWTGWSTGALDVNNDGRKDLFAAGGHVMDNAELSSNSKSRQPNILFLNRGHAQFDTQLLEGEALHRGAAFGDFDRDGRMDVVVTRLNESPQVLYNRTPSKAHWIGFRLRGRRSNRDGIGALVHLQSASGEQWTRVATSAGYGGSRDAAVHFGLGSDASAVRVEIRWPSGVTQTLRDIAGDQYHLIEEPQ